MAKYVGSKGLGLIEHALEQCAEKIRQNMASEGRNASGKYSKSIRVEMHESGGQITAAAYFGTTEHGRKPGNVPKDIVAILEAWITDKGVSVKQIPYKRQETETWQPKYTVAERSRKMAASAMAWSIKENGTRLYRDGGEPVIYSPAINGMLDALVRQIADIVVAEVLT